MRLRTLKYVVLELLRMTEDRRLSLSYAKLEIIYVFKVIVTAGKETNLSTGESKVHTSMVLTSHLFAAGEIMECRFDHMA